MKNFKVLGIDIETGYSTLKEKVPLYSIALIENEKILDLKEKQTLKDIIIYIRKNLPTLIATDNIFEIIKDEKELRKISMYLPSNVNIVQVTGNPLNPEKTLIELAKEIGIKVKSKLRPLETAILVAKLALKGYGYKLKMQEDETLIIVSKQIEPSAGGMSLNRNKRNVQAKIVQAINSIKSNLIKNNIPFDFFPSKTSEGGVFIVNLPKNKIKKIVKPYKGNIFQIKVIPIIRNKLLTSLNLTKKEKLLIVGYDPGITVGISVLDLEGNLILTESFKYTGLSDIRNKLLKIGKPIIIATDKANISNMVNKLASSFGAIIFKPQRDLTIKEKKEKVLKYLNKIKQNIKLNFHKRDSLSAALYAFAHYSEIFNQIKKEIKNKEIGYLNPEKIFEKNIKTNKNIKEIIEEEIENYLNNKIEEKRIKIKQNKEEKNEKFKKIKEKMLEFEKQINLLTEEIRKKNKIISNLEKTIEKMKEENYRKIKEEKEIKILNKKVEDLKFEIEKIKEEKENYKNQIKEIIKKINEMFENKIILLEIFNDLIDVAKKEKIKEYIVVRKILKVEEKILNSLIKRKIKTIIYIDKCDEKILKYLKEQGINVIKINEIDNYYLENICFINRIDINQKEKEFEKEKKENIEKVKKSILKIITDYRYLKI